MLHLLLPHERNVVRVEGDVQAKLREESEALGIGRHRAKTKLVLAPAITDPLQALYFRLLTLAHRANRASGVLRRSASLSPALELSK